MFRTWAILRNAGFTITLIRAMSLLLRSSFGMFLLFAHWLYVIHMSTSYFLPSRKSTDPAIIRTSSGDFPSRQCAAVKMNFFLMITPVQICVASSKYLSLLCAIETTERYNPLSTLLTIGPWSGSAQIKILCRLPEFWGIPLQSFHWILNINWTCLIRYMLEI